MGKLLGKFGNSREMVNKPAKVGSAHG